MGAVAYRGRRLRRHPQGVRRISIVPVVKSSGIDRSLTHYVDLLGFRLAGVWPERADPPYAILLHEGEELHISSHAGDGQFGQATIVPVEDVDAVF